MFNNLSTQGRVDNATGYFAESWATLCFAGLQNMFDEKATSLFMFSLFIFWRVRCWTPLLTERHLVKVISPALTPQYTVWHVFHLCVGNKRQQWNQWITVLLDGEKTWFYGLFVRLSWELTESFYCNEIPPNKVYCELWVLSNNLCVTQRSYTITRSGNHEIPFSKNSAQKRLNYWNKCCWNQTATSILIEQI